jgi:acetyltransferase-like isoleucine patch superfamily enzyme
MPDKIVRKDDILKNISEDDSGAIKKYQSFFTGQTGFLSLLKYDIAHIIASPMPGAIGYVLRKMLMLPLLGNCGKNVNIGRSVNFRHPFKISIGDNTAIDDYCMLDAKGVSRGEFTIGKNVLISRGCTLVGKTDHGFIEIGDNSIFGKNCIISSTGGIKLGDWVGLAGDCFVGGGRYRTQESDKPMMKQEMYSHGPVEIGDDVWIGAGVTILDGVKIGSGSVIGAGSVVRENIPENTTVTPHQRLVMLPKKVEESKKEA